MNNFKQFFFVGIVILAFAFYLGFNSPANSNVTDNVSGYAWNSDGMNPTDIGGMGWLSFNNCISAGICPAPSYGVNIDSVGNILGYAWAGNSFDSNINGFGWIKFGGLSDFPSGPGTTSLNAKLSGGNISGWARACAVFQSGCSGDYYHSTGPVNNILVPPNPNPNNIQANPYLGGWDGWISLRGTDYGVVVNQSSGAFSGYAWGGPDVVGWIDFSQVIKGASVSSELILSADSTVVYPPLYQTTLRWSSSVPLNRCIATSSPTVDTINSWNREEEDPRSSKLVDVPANPIPVRYNLTCKDSSNDDVPAAPVYVSRVESVAFSNTAVQKKDTDYITTLSWNTVNASSCKSYGPSGSGWEDGVVKANSGSQPGVIVTAVTPNVDTYSITCIGTHSGSSITPTSLKLNITSGSSIKQPHYIER